MLELLRNLPSKVISNYITGITGITGVAARTEHSGVQVKPFSTGARGFLLSGPFDPQSWHLGV